MNILANPVILRAVVVLVCSAFFFLLGFFVIKSLRKKISEEAEELDGPSVSMETLPLDLYNTVIQQLKQQKHELQVQSQAEQHRARTSENFSQAVLSNLNCGVLVFGANGLVKTTNAAAKTILGFGSVQGMGPENIFREAQSGRNKSASNESDRVLLAHEIQAVLREGSRRRQVEGDYETPSGEKRFLSMTISQVPSLDGTLLGVACLINDVTELEKIRRQQELQGELSAEMALQLRTSLATIAGYAQQLANNRDPDMAQQLAVDIAQEAAQLDRNIGGFLTAKPMARAAGAGR